jgi:hypothetical protein
MNRGQACRSTEETSWEEARAPFPSLAAPIRTPSAVPVSSTRRARSTADTLRGTADPFADTEGVLPGAAGCRDWCVDRGADLLTMSTFELWAALERGEIAAWMRVWREGMECWTPAGELLELSWATAGTPQPSIQAEAMASEATTGPVPLLEPSPVPREASGAPRESSRAPREVSRVPEIAAAPSLPRPELSRAPAPSRVQAHAGRWVAAGSLVAAVAIAAAFFVAAGGGAEAPAEHAAVTVTAIAAPPPMRAPEVSAPTLDDDPPRPEPARREERGQRRLPRGGGRAYGR